MSGKHFMLPALLAMALCIGMAGAAASPPADLSPLADFYEVTDAWDTNSKYVFASSDDYVPEVALYGGHEQMASECARVLADDGAGELDANWCAEYAGFVSGDPDARIYLERTEPLEAGPADIITFYDPDHINWHVKWSICSVTPAPSGNPDTVIECTAVVRIWTGSDAGVSGAGVFEW